MCEPFSLQTSSCILCGGWRYRYDYSRGRYKRGNNRCRVACARGCAGCVVRGMMCVAGIWCVKVRQWHRDTQSGSSYRAPRSSAPGAGAGAGAGAAAAAPARVAGWVAPTEQLAAGAVDSPSLVDPASLAWSPSDDVLQALAQSPRVVVANHVGPFDTLSLFHLTHGTFISKVCRPPLGAYAQLCTWL